MPEYTLAAIAWLTASLVLAWAAGIASRRATWIAAAVFLGFTIVFDALLTGLPIVRYGETTMLGARLGPIPVEDLVYGVALFFTAVGTAELVAARRRR
jgi:lycopene cyclase domain-containing protein